VPLRPQAAKIYATNEAKWRAGDLSYDPTATLCVSPGMPRILYLPYPFQIIQQPDRLSFMFEWNHWNRHVVMARQPQDVLYPLSLGVSNAYWDRDTLVINTIGLRADNTLLDQAGMPHSDSLSLLERLRVIDAGRRLEDRLRIEDPQTFTRPWETVVKFRRLPAGTEIHEDVCLDRLDAGKPAIVWSRRRAAAQRTP
jgi:hypothetical protein